MPAPRNYWMVVLTPENFHILQGNGFTLMGLERSLKKRAQRMEVGDRVLFYVQGQRFFAATATDDLFSSSSSSRPLLSSAICE